MHRALANNLYETTANSKPEYSSQSQSDSSYPTIDLHRLANLNILEDRLNAHLLNLMYDRKDNPNFTDSRNLFT